jgi:hypothetical protein
MLREPEKQKERYVQTTLDPEPTSTLNAQRSTLQPTHPRNMTQTAVDRGRPRSPVDCSRLPPQTGLDHAALVYRHCRLDWTTQSVDYSPQSGTDRGEHCSVEGRNVCSVPPVRAQEDYH